MNELTPINDAPQTQALNVYVSPSALLERAIQSGVTPEVLEKLMGLQERWVAQNAKAAFNKAMADMRESLPPIIKNQKVDFSTGRGRTNYSYEDLNDVTEVLTPHMAKHGLAFRWRTQPGDPVTVACIVSHRDGHSEESSLSAPRDESGNKNAIQGLGSTITYLQRYTLKAALGVAAAPDDDGQSAGQRPAPQQQRPAPQQQTQPQYRPATTAREVAPPAPTGPTEKTRAWMLDNLKQFESLQLREFAISKGWLGEVDELATWPLEKVPANRAGLQALVREIEDFLEPKAATAPALTDQGEFSEPFWNQRITMPRAGMKRAEYMRDDGAHIDTIRSLYEASKAGDEKAGHRLFGIANEWMPQEWTGNDGKLRPPSDADVECRRSLDQFLEYMDAKKGEK